MTIEFKIRSMVEIGVIRFVERGPEKVIGMVLLYLEFGCVITYHMQEAMKSHVGVM